RALVGPPRRCSSDATSLSFPKPWSPRPRLRREGGSVGAARVEQRVVTAKPQEVDEIGLDLADELDAAEHQAGIELHQRRARLDLGEGSGAGIDTAHADKRELLLHAHIRLG